MLTPPAVVDEPVGHGSEEHDGKLLRFVLNCK